MTTTRTTTLRGRTRRRWTNDDNNDDNNNNDKDIEDKDVAKGGNCLNGTVVGQEYSQPCNWHPAHGPGAVHAKTRLVIPAGILRISVFFLSCGIFFTGITIPLLL
jgi:hypothetical protein